MSIVGWRTAGTMTARMAEPAWTMIEGEPQEFTLRGKAILAFGDEEIMLGSEGGNNRPLGAERTPHPCAG